MIKIEEIKIGGVYRGKTGLPRKVKQFWRYTPGRGKKVTSPTGADIEYIRVDADGKDYKGGLATAPLLLIGQLRRNPNDHR